MIGQGFRSPVRGLSPDEAASYWLVRIDGGLLPAEEQAQFDAWLSASPANDAAFARATAAWKVFDAAAGDPNLDALRETALAAGHESRRGLWLGLGAGVAASLLAMGVFGAGFLPSPVHRELARAPRPMVSAASAPATHPDRGDFVTAKGERRTVALADGTAITLNTDSAVRVDYQAERRLVRLLRGQALFEVARNPARPFVVQAADRQVTALGTVFEVRLDPDRMKVTLVEGKVVIDAIGDVPAKDAALMVPTVLTPGQSLVAMIGAPGQLAKVDVDQQLRWREGFVEFNDVPLEAAVREMNRYSSHELAIRDAGIGDIRVSGVFRTGNPERFAAILAEILPIETHIRTDDRIELSARSRAQ